MTALATFPIKDFAGLNYRDAPDNVGPGQAIDMKNVDFTAGGTIRSRDGYAQLGSAMSAAYNFIYSYSSGKILARRGTTLAVHNGVSSELTTIATANAVTRAVNYGTPSATYAYISDSTNALKRYDGTTLSTPTVSVDGVGSKVGPKGIHLAVQTDSNRLVVAGTTGGSSVGGPDGLTSTSSTVWFSNPLNAEAYTSTDYVHLTPGDGESIQGAVSWRGQVFVFKKTRMFVFYGNSLDANGGTIFNYRTIELGTRVVSNDPSYSGPQVIAGDDAVYFVSATGVWQTTGGPPTLISRPIPSPTDLEAFSFFSGTFPDSALAGTHLGYWNRRLYVGIGGTSHVFVYDVDRQEWLYWELATPFVYCFANSKGTELPTLIWSDDDKLIQTFSPNGHQVLTTDNGAAIASYYRSGFFDVGDDFKKELREVRIWGTGTVGFANSLDFGAPETAISTTLGTSPAITEGVVSGALTKKSGTLYSFKLSASSGAWSVQRLNYLLPPSRVPGVKTP